jgi:tetratricopeptide (TPR) repeat protein
MFFAFLRRRTPHGLYGLFCVLAMATSPSVAAEPVVRGYALTSAPLDILDRLSELKLGPSPRLSDSARTLLAATWELRAKADSSKDLEIDPDRVLEAMLLASGVDAPAEREKYRQQFARLVDQAREATSDAPTPRERGERLMQFLHSSVMHKGYDEAQTSFTAIFETGQANCVSATAMYYLVGTRLGLDLQPISIPSEGVLPGHASLDMIDAGERIQVEPTNPDGFDWETKSNRPDVTVIGYVPSRKEGHEIDALGLAAMIYSNRGVTLSKAARPRWLEAARCYLAALCLDPQDGSATNNLLTVFVNWGPTLATERKFEDAVRVLAFGQAIAPESDELDNNQRVVWSQYIEDLLSAGKDEEALPIIRRAAEATGDDEWRSASYWFIRHGEKRLEENWEAALEVVQRGLKVLPAAEAQALLEWRSSVFRRWSQELLAEKQDVDGSLKVLARAYELNAMDEAIVAGVAFHTQEALQMLDDKQGLPAALEHYQSVRKSFPKLEEVAEVGRSFARDELDQLLDDKKFEEAVAAVDQYRAIVVTPEERAELCGIAYERWAEDFVARQEWRTALDKCAEGLKDYPKQDGLTNRIRIIVDAWAQPAIDGKNWNEAIRIYDVGLEYLANDRHLQHNRKYCESMTRAK